MKFCKLHLDFFDDNCKDCKEEYIDFKKIDDIEDNKIRQTKGYREFTEEKARSLYEQLFLYYLKKGTNPESSSHTAKNIIKKQCSIRKIPFWRWL